MSNFEQAVDYSVQLLRPSVEDGTFGERDATFAEILTKWTWIRRDLINSIHPPPPESRMVSKLHCLKFTAEHDPQHYDIAIETLVAAIKDNEPLPEELREFAIGVLRVRSNVRRLRTEKPRDSTQYIPSTRLLNSSVKGSILC